jgi:hypothetical protein
MANEEPGIVIRVFVVAFLALFLGAGLFGVEAWPLTGWRLYSRLRHGQQWSWQVGAVAPDGRERLLDLHRLPAAYHGVPYVLGSFEGLSAEAKESACRGLGEAARLQYPDVTGVVIDHIRGSVARGPDAPVAAPSGRIRSYQCRLG